MFLFGSLAVAQQQKGGAASAEPLLLQTDNLYALVIGVARYENSKEVENLRYADVDAKRFAEFLRKHPKICLKDDHLELYVNEQATTGNIGNAIERLARMGRAAKNPTLVFYFSGHGASQGNFSPPISYLRLYNSAPNDLSVGGLPFVLLAPRLGKLAEEGWKVVVIIDACYAGKFAATESLLGIGYDRIVKMLSSQQGQISFEDETRSGGRFTIALLDGLGGKADYCMPGAVPCKDGNISLAEIDAYLRNVMIGIPGYQVPTVAPLDSPLFLCREDRKIVTEILSRGFGASASGGSLCDNRDRFQQILDKETETIRIIARSFCDAVSKHRLIREYLPKNSNEHSAVYFYKLLMEHTRSAEAKQAFRETILASLLDESVSLLSSWTQGKCDTSSESRWLRAARSITAAHQIVGPTDALYRPIRMHYLYWRSMVAEEAGDSLASVITLLQECCRLDSNAAYVYHDLGNAYCRMGDRAKALEYLHRANRLAPTWAMNLHRLGSVYAACDSTEYDTAVEFFTKAIEADSSYTPAFLSRSKILNKQGRFDAAIEDLRRATSIRAESMGCIRKSFEILLASAFIYRKEYDSAQKYISQILENEPKDPGALFAYGFLCQTKCLDPSNDASILQEGVTAMKEAMRLDSTFTDEGNSNLGWFYLDLGNLAASEEYFTKVLNRPRQPDCECGESLWLAPFGLSLVYEVQGSEEKSRRMLDRAIQLEPLLKQGMRGLAITENYLYFSPYEKKLALSLFKKAGIEK